ncbi:MAG: DUF3772 domain-containing protein [Pseudomonadota bacterium]
MRPVWLCLALILSLAFAPAPVAWAQSDATQMSADEFATWEQEASRAEGLIEAGRASTAFFENLRTNLVDYRGRFLAFEDANEARIATIQAQIEALGPPPGDGETEAAPLAERRAALSQRLAEAQLPRVQATEAFNRADGLIAEIDELLTDRQAEELLELDPTPLNPVNWATALSALGSVTATQIGELRARISDETMRDNAWEGLGRVLLLSAIGLYLIVRGRKWVTVFAEALQKRSTQAGRLALSYAVSLGQVALPLGGIVLILYALSRTGLASDDLTAILSAALQLMLSIFAAIWLAGRLFRQGEDRQNAFDLSSELRARARRAVLIIGTFMGLGTLAHTLNGLDQMPPSAWGVLVLPTYLGLAYGFWRLARVILAARSAVPEDETPGFALRASAILARALVVVAGAGPVLAAIGYLNATEALMVPTALTLFVLGIFLSLQPVVRDLYALVFRSTQEAASDALTPVLLNFALAFGAAPLIALIWGIRPERLQEFYSRFLEGFTIGDARLTPTTILAVILVFAIGFMLTRLLQGALKSTVLPRTRLDTGARNAVTSGVGYVGIALAAVIAITAGGIDLTALGFVLGALSVGIGFGLQNVVSNFVSGIILLIERPISEGDWIEVNGNMGIVKDISVRSTRIETFDRTDVIVPNADFISGTVTNWTRGNNIGRAVLTVGVAYGTDTRRVQDILTEIARNHPNVATFPEPGVDFLGFGADSLDFRIRAILRDVNQLLTVKTELNHQIAERFAEEGIEIPFAQRDIWLRNPETLREAASPTPPPIDESPSTV